MGQRQWVYDEYCHRTYMEYGTPVDVTVSRRCESPVEKIDETVKVTSFRTKHAG